MGRPPPKVRVLQSQQRVVPLRKELTISRIIDNPSEMMINWVLPNNTEVLNLKFGTIAQKVEHLVEAQGVTGSIPVRTTESRINGKPHSHMAASPLSW